MSKISASPDISQVKPEELARFVDIFCHDVVQKVNGDLDFQNNINCKLVSIPFAAANTEASVSHGLGRVPTGYLVYGATAAMSVYNGVSTNTAALLYLRASAVGTANLIVF